MTHEEVIQRAAKHMMYRAFFFVSDKDKERIAKTPKDFQRILDREREKRQLKNEKLLVEQLRSYVSKMLQDLFYDYNGAGYELRDDEKIYADFLNWLQTGERRNKPTNKSIVAAIKLLLNAGIEEIEAGETNINFLIRICEKYQLRYNEKVRQGFSGAISEKYYKEAERLLIPTFPHNVQERIIDYLRKNGVPKF